MVYISLARTGSLGHPEVLGSWGGEYPVSAASMVGAGPARSRCCWGSHGPEAAQVPRKALRGGEHEPGGAGSGSEPGLASFKRRRKGRGVMPPQPP